MRNFVHQKRKQIFHYVIVTLKHLLLLDRTQLIIIIITFFYYKIVWFAFLVQREF